MSLPEVDMFYRELGELIKRERLLKKVSQDSLADYLELTRLSVINLEKGRHRPSIYQIALIAQFLGIEYSKLVPILLDTNRHNTTNDELKGKVDSVLDPEEFDDGSKDVVLGFLSTLSK